MSAGGGFVLVTGDPPPVPHLLSQALRKATQFRPAVVDIACRADLTADELSRASSVVAALPTGGTPAGSEIVVSAPPIFVLADADQLSNRRIREICETTEHASHKDAAALLLARPSFLARIEEDSLRSLRQRLVARFEFSGHWLGRGRRVSSTSARVATRPQRGARLNVWVARWFGSFGGAPDPRDRRFFIPRVLLLGWPTISAFRCPGSRGATIHAERDAGGSNRADCPQAAAKGVSITARRHYRKRACLVTPLPRLACRRRYRRPSPVRCPRHWRISTHPQRRLLRS